MVGLRYSKLERLINSFNKSNSSMDTSKSVSNIDTWT